MPPAIRFSDVEEIVEVVETVHPVGFSADSSAPSLSAARVILRCRLLATDRESLDALCYARRAMLREEWTRGVEDGEASLGDAMFSAFEVSWSVPADAVPSGRAKLSELVERANRARTDVTSVRA